MVRREAGIGRVIANLEPWVAAFRVSEERFWLTQLFNATGQVAGLL
jgi:hypothetical protein